MKRTLVTWALATSLVASTAQSHDITLWPEQDGKSVKLRMYYGDPGDYQPIDEVRFVELTVLDSRDVKISFIHDIERGADNKVLTTPALRLGDWPAGTYVVESRYDNGFYVHDGENRAIATTREWYPAAIDSAHYQKFSKALFHLGPSGGGYDRIVGHRLELIPRADPFNVKDGGTLAIEVRFDGAPLKDHIVEVGDETAASKGPEVHTDGRGLVQVKLDHKGFYRLAVDHRAPSRYPDLFSFDDYTASLVFSR